MPFASDKQRKYLYANKPNVANKLKKHKKTPKKYNPKGLLGSRNIY